MRRNSINKTAKKAVKRFFGSLDYFSGLLPESNSCFSCLVIGLSS